MAAWAPNPIERSCNAQRSATVSWRCFEEACRQGLRGPVEDMRLIARPWGFDLASLNVPVLLWHGERDRNVPVEHGRYLAGAIPNCRATFYADDAHLSVPLTSSRGDFWGAGRCFGCLEIDCAPSTLLRVSVNAAGFI